jgi:hypothetical protein
MTSFDSVWLKIGRSKQHIDDLEAAIIAFHRTNPYPLVTEDDPQTGKRMVKIGKGPAPIPDAGTAHPGRRGSHHPVQSRPLRLRRRPGPERADGLPCLA